MAESPVVVAPPPTKPATPGVMNRPVNDGKPIAKAVPKPTEWTVEDGERLGELIEKRDKFLAEPRKLVTIGELRAKIAMLPADAEVMYEDWRDGGAVRATSLFSDGKTLVIQ